MNRVNPVRKRETLVSKLVIRRLNKRTTGLPDFSWYVIPKTEKNVPNEYKMYDMVIKYP
jgi:hypothetical protein